ncbi:MAG: hypothetical protein QY321_01550 [Patescibacteria group bacterium]|nr:MAG: hypothetical protein QY321_01550 [Patescibacteria group bacterium]
MPETEKTISPESPINPETVSPDKSMESPTLPEKPAEKADKVVKDDDVFNVSATASSGQDNLALAPDQARILEIERILEEDLSELYFQIPEDRRQEFKVKGEAAAREISELLKVAKVKISKLVEVIRRWLSLIPGVNVFFLEQEAKIKADKLLSWREEKNNKS